MAESTYKFNVAMSCSSCSNAVDRVLKKTEGISSYTVSLESQEVVVNTALPLNDIQAKIKKTGKEIRSAEVVSGPAVGA